MGNRTQSNRPARRRSNVLPPLFCVTPEFVSSFLSFFFLIAFPILSFLFSSTAKEEKGMRGKRKERRGLKLNATRERKKNQPYTYTSTQ